MILFGVIQREHLSPGGVAVRDKFSPHDLASLEAAYPVL